MKNAHRKFLSAATLAGITLLAGCGNANTITFWNPLTGDDGAYMDAWWQNTTKQILSSL